MMWKFIQNISEESTIDIPTPHDIDYQPCMLIIDGLPTSLSL